jgi:hypothetical protein
VEDIAPGRGHRSAQGLREQRNEEMRRKLTCGPTFVLEACGATLARVKMTLHTISLAFKTKNEYFITTFNVHGQIFTFE